jgi:hypothetical protein
MIGAIAGLSALGGSLALAKAAMVRAADEYAQPVRGLDRVRGPQRSGGTRSATESSEPQSDAAADVPGGDNAAEAVDAVEISPQAYAKAQADADNRFSVAMDKLPGAEKEQLQKLRKRDQEVRAHEAAHKAAGGQYAGSPSFSYQTGPDGQQYAVGGEVPIDLSPVQGDPQATIAKMQQIRAAALAPASPSDADRQVAAKASELQQQARTQLAAESAQDTGGGSGQRQREPGAEQDQAIAAAPTNASLESSFLDVYA